MRGRVVDPKIITELSNQLFSIFRGAGFNTHSQKLASPNICHLRVPSFQDQIVLDRLPLRIPGQRLVLDDNFYCET
jgi:hypothetical protein